jgi:hypothetical protein
MIVSLCVKSSIRELTFIIKHLYILICMEAIVLIPVSKRDKLINRFLFIDMCVIVFIDIDA